MSRHDDLVARYACAIEDALERDLRAHTRREVERRTKAERAARRLAPKRVAPSRVSTHPSTIVRGSTNEHRAALELEGKGYAIVARNYRCGLGELDLIARDGETLVFVEVRSRHDGEHGHAAEMVNARKRRKVSRVAWFYIETQRPVFRRIRFDVVAITGAILDHLEDAWRL